MATISIEQDTLLTSLEAMSYLRVSRETAVSFDVVEPACRAQSRRIVALLPDRCAGVHQGDAHRRETRGKHSEPL